MERQDKSVSLRIQKPKTLNKTLYLLVVWYFNHQYTDILAQKKLTCCHHRGCWLAGHTVSLSSLGGRCRWSHGAPLGGSHPGHRRPSGRAGSLAPPRGPATVWWCSVLSQSQWPLSPARPPGPAASRWYTGYGGSRGSWCHCVLLSCAAGTRDPRRLRPVLAYLKGGKHD